MTGCAVGAVRHVGALAALCLMVVTSSGSAEVPPAVLQAEADRVEVLGRICQSVVAIFASNGQGGGSGVLISRDGYALSNFHVTSECGIGMKCGLADGKLYDAVLVGLDPTGDVALIKLLGRSDFPSAELADSDQVRVGDSCFAIGNPFLLATDFTPTVSYGVVSGVHRYQYPSGTLLEYADCIQSDAAINPGNSGGPMFDADGRLIGINGRGSFEKRGRVNVGVGYAISINQIKHFLGHLKAGRLVDHATLGARVVSDDGRVTVDDILDDSDALRRGIRFGDEILRFGGRSMISANAFKNVLGIFPKGWKVPLSYRHKTAMHDVLVRLAGVHTKADLDAMAARLAASPHGDKQDDPPDQKLPPEIPEPDKPQRKEPPKLPFPGLKPKAEPLAEIVKQHYEAKRGYVNYYFNRVERDRVWKAFVARGDHEGLVGNWKISGTLAGGGDFAFEISAEESALQMPGGRLKTPIKGDLSESFDPPGSGGLLVTMGLWRRLLTVGPERFGDLAYLGTMPLYRSTLHDPPTSFSPASPLADVYSASYGGVDVLFYFDVTDGSLALVETFADDGSDPCELHLGDYREVEGRMWPQRMEVRFSDAVYNVFQCRHFTFGGPGVNDAGP